MSQEQSQVQSEVKSEAPTDLIAFVQPHADTLLRDWRHDPANFQCFPYASSARVEFIYKRITGDTYPYWIRVDGSASIEGNCWFLTMQCHPTPFAHAFRIVWKDGGIETIFGDELAEAFVAVGYGAEHVEKIRKINTL